MNSSLSKINARIISIVSLVVLLGSCSNSDTTDNFSIPHYRLVTTLDSEPVHLSASVGQPPWAIVIDGRPPSTFDSGAAWKIRGELETAVRIDSLFEIVGNVVHLEIDPTGTMQNLIRVGYQETTDWGVWNIERLSNGLCHIKNEKLGNEFVLTVDTSTTPKTAIMAAIDSALTQEWGIEAFLQPEFNYEKTCNGIPDST